MLSISKYVHEEGKEGESEGSERTWSNFIDN